MLIEIYSSRIFLLFFAFLLIGLGRNLHAQSADGTPLTEHVRANLEEARTAANDMMMTLGGNLKDAIAERGLAGAVDFCASEVHALSAQTLVKHRTGIQVHRVTERPRNPVNRIAAEEREISERFPVRRAETSQEYYEQRGTAFVYARPIYMDGVCLACHGPRDSLAEEVRRVLEERYPHDQAVGYSLGELRGIVLVTIDPPHGVGR